VCNEAQEAMRADINQLKDQMGQILEALVTLKSANENPVVRNEDATSSNPVVSQLGVMSI